MNETYYNLVFRAEDGDIWTHQDKFNRPVNFYTKEKINEVIEEFFQDPQVVEASIFRIDKTLVDTVKNIDDEFETAKDRISDVFMSVDLNKRARLLEFFNENMVTFVK